ncbi:MAG: amino acid ABC transporter ATP-binding protein [Acholeplasmataceae bacterium]|nr:amino acid ABC transporter ATP-binding protein [Acholeplasmataceae bacterium]
MSLLSIKNIYKSYDNTPILKNVSLNINKGEVITIIGQSGSGKTTLLRCLNLLAEPDSGHIYFLNDDLTDPNTNINEMRQQMGMVFQSFNLFSNLNVIENCMLALTEVLKLDKKQAEERAVKYLTKVGMQNFIHKSPHTLSGGQQQRVAIARALCMEPQLMLFDEPTSALDPLLVDEVLNVIKDLAIEGMTMVIVTHEMSFAYEISNRIIFMDEGEIVEEGSPDQIFKVSTNPKTRKFIDNFLRKQIIL